MSNTNIDATIQQFEFTFELGWKFLKKYFLTKDILLNNPKEVLQEAFVVGLIGNEKVWLQMLTDQSNTSHTYDEKLADELYMRIRGYVADLKQLLNIKL